MATPQTGFSVIQVRRAATATWNSTNPVLRKGEPGVEFKTNGTYRLKIGDGVTAWNNLAYVTDVTIDELSDVVISAPQNDQGIVYENGLWKNKTVIAAASVNKVKPSPAADGALWFDPEDGRLYRYYVDTDSTAQWIEIKQAPAQQSNVFTSGVTMQSTLDVSGTTTLGTLSASSATISTPLGIASGGTGVTAGAGWVPITPTSVTGGGTNTINADGSVTMTNSTNTIFNGVFTSTYRNYKAFFSSASTHPANQFYLRLTSGGTQDTTTNYTYTSMYIQGAGPAGVGAANSVAQNVGVLSYAADMEMTFYCPQISRVTDIHYNATYSYTAFVGECYFQANTQFDGFQFFNNTTNGVMRIYGLR